jgi:malonate-semialdehyde dehydrogenase (acetylating)/methylmalonate-semialdehyde dehydrogenase
MARKLKNFVGGSWVDSQTKTFDDVINPATEEIIASVPLSTKKDLDKAVATAQEAFQSWKNVAAPKRARVMFKFHQLLTEHKKALAKIITIENGKSYTEALCEVQ